MKRLYPPTWVLGGFKIVMVTIACKPVEPWPVCCVCGLSSPVKATLALRDGRPHFLAGESCVTVWWQRQLTYLLRSSKAWKIVFKLSKSWVGVICWTGSQKEIISLTGWLHVMVDFISSGFVDINLKGQYWHDQQGMELGVIFLD